MVETRRLAIDQVGTWIGHGRTLVLLNGFARPTISLSGPGDRPDYLPSLQATLAPKTNVSDNKRLSQTEILPVPNFEAPLVSRTRNRLVSSIAQQINRMQTDHTKVAVDGVDGAGKTTFADELANKLQVLGRSVIRASVDDFHNPKAIRYSRGHNSPQGYFRDSFDYPKLKSLLLDPLSLNGTGLCQLRWFDYRIDECIPASQVKAEPNSVLVFDGVFLHRDELTSYWDYSVFLQVPFTVSYQRMATRDGGSADPDATENRRYLKGQKIYLAHCQPVSKATLVVDNESIEAPFIVRRL
jgi:uridine kinase